MRGFGSKYSKKQDLSYIPYRDSEGNVLAADEILFTDEKGYSGKQTLAVWDEEDTLDEENSLTINSPGVAFQFDESGHFPIGLISPKGKRMYLKVSAKTGEILPMHAGCCQSLDIIYTGPSQAGKTINILQLSDSGFHDLIAGHTNCSIEDDLPVISESRRRYEKSAYHLFKNHILPEKTHKRELVTPYVYYVTYKDSTGVRKSMLVRLQDIDGDSCVEMSWDSKLIPYDYFFLTIGADELIASEQGDPVLYPKVVDQLIQKLRMFKDHGDFDIIVIISKADLLKGNKALKEVFENSIYIDENGKMQQKTHKFGFDQVAFAKREACIKKYLMSQCPNLMNKLLNACNENRIRFCMIASIGEEVKVRDNDEGDQERYFENFQPICIDEPILTILSRQGLYPIASFAETIKTEEIEDTVLDQMMYKMKSRFKSTIANVKVKMKEIEDDDHDDIYD